MKGNSNNKKDDKLARTLHRLAILLAVVLCVVFGIYYWVSRSEQTPVIQESEIVE